MSRREIVILAGGQSERMGHRDKLMLDFGGEPMIEHQVATAGELDQDVVVVGKVPDVRILNEKVSFIEDRRPGRGPLEGIRTALLHCESPIQVLVGDMPRVTAESLRWLWKKFVRFGAEKGMLTQ